MNSWGQQKELSPRRTFLFYFKTVKNTFSLFVCSFYVYGWTDVPTLTFYLKVRASLSPAEHGQGSTIMLAALQCCTYCKYWCFEIIACKHQNANIFTTSMEAGLPCSQFKFRMVACYHFIMSLESLEYARTKK